MTTPLHHTRILASAGSGKTYQLTNRFIRLLLMEIPPERILALTFTRMAAGEFFDAILHKLADAARDPEVGKALARQLQVEDEPDWEQLLGEVLPKMGHLRLGTLDGFFHDMLSAFSTEFGLGPSFRLMEESEASWKRFQMFREFFQRQGIREEDRHHFAEAFKQATFGEDQKSLLQSLERFIESQHSLYLAAPAAEAWGNRRSIWPEDGGPWKKGIDRPAAVRDIKRALEPQLSAGRVQKGWWTFLDFAETWQPGMELKGAIPEAIEAAREDLKNGKAEISYHKTAVTLEGASAHLLIDLMDTLYHLELERSLQRTQGIHTMMEAYERHYQRLVRRQGNLTFEDIQLLLSRAGQEKSPGFTQQGGGDASAALLDIHFRMDGQFDHWLLDEFQDTSRLQWSILENLVDEVVMDPEGRRSLFFVGDIKQAIYGWRGGDAGLFEAVSARYSAPGHSSPLETLNLQESWRSGPEVIELVNCVFGREAVRKQVFTRTPEAVRQWTALWKDHSSARPDHSGYAAHIKVEDREARLMAVHEILENLEIQKRGMTCALLVQTNDQVRQWVRELRARGDYPLVEERDVSVASDNALGALLSSLLQALAHPADSFAWEHLRMSPLGPVFLEEGWDYPAFQRKGFHLLAEGGFENVLEFWIHKLYPESIPDAFLALRAEQILEAARQFDREGIRDLDAFRIHLKGYRVRSGEAAAGIRVMTIHQSKGLGFDVVLLPELERRGSQSLDKIRDGLGVSRDALGQPRWILDLPKAAISEVDPTLRAFRREQQEDSAFESHCLFYVALTRAKRSLYCITETRAKPAQTPEYVSWLDLALEGEDSGDFPGDGNLEVVWSRGEPSWFESIPQKEVESSRASIPVEAFTEAKEPLELVNPSRMEGRDRLPAFSSNRRWEAGLWIHRAFEQVEWWSQEVPEQLQRWQEKQATENQPLVRMALETVLRSLKEPAVQNLFREVPQVKLYREQPFDLVVENARISGQWDRLQVEPGQRALLVDFKAGSGLDEKGLRERFGPQLLLYRKAVAEAFDLPEDFVECKILLYEEPSVRLLDLGSVSS